MFDFAKQVALVSCDATGIGRATREAFARSGGRVVAAGINAEEAERAIALHPIKRLLRSHEVADAELWLMSVSTLGIGHALLVDGGYVAQ